LLRGLSLQPRATSRPVVMGPGARPGRRACLFFDSIFKQPNRHCERKRSNPSLGVKKECIASLAMTSRHSLAFPRRDAPESWMSLPPIEGAGNTGCALHPRSRVQKCTKKRTRAYRFSGGNPAFPAQWFYGLFRALPGDRAFLPPSPAKVAFRELDASVGASGPHDFAVRTLALSSLAPPASTASHPASVTIAIRPSKWGETAGI
jgi:hypothetical protein